MTITLKTEVCVAWWVRWYLYTLVLLSRLGIQSDPERSADRLIRGVRVRVVELPPEG